MSRRSKNLTKHTFITFFFQDTTRCFLVKRQNVRPYKKVMVFCAIIVFRGCGMCVCITWARNIRAIKWNCVQSFRSVWNFKWQRRKIKVSHYTTPISSCFFYVVVCHKKKGNNRIKCCSTLLVHNSFMLVLSMY